LRCRGTPQLAHMQLTEPPSTLTGEQSNVSIAFGRQALMKLFRRLRAGQQPEVEVPRFLTQFTDFQHTPDFLGLVELEEHDGQVTVLATVSAFVENQGDAWSAFVHALERQIEDRLVGSAP